MQEIKYLTVRSAVRECVNKERFCVGIFTRTQANRLSVCLELLESMDEEEQKATHRAVRNTNSSFIEFKNGSYIKVFGASQNARGHAFHKVLHEPGIDYEVLNCVVRYTEKLRF